VKRSLTKELDVAQLEDQLKEAQESARAWEDIAERRNLLVHECIRMFQDSMGMLTTLKLSVLQQEDADYKRMEKNYLNLVKDLALLERPNGKTILTERALNGGKIPSPLARSSSRVYFKAPSLPPQTRSQLTGAATMTMVAPCPSGNGSLHVPNAECFACHQCPKQ